MIPVLPALIHCYDRLESLEICEETSKTKESLAAGSQFHVAGFQRLNLPLRRSVPLETAHSDLFIPSRPAVPLSLGAGVPRQLLLSRIELLQ